MRYRRRTDCDALIIVITEYYTGTNYRPVKSVAAASVTGHGTNVIQGLAVSLEATALPALVIIARYRCDLFNLAGLFGIAIAVTTMLATCRSRSSRSTPSAP